MTAASPQAFALVGPGDDAAVLPDGSVVTVDALVEGVHFDGRLAPEDVGYKAVAVSASDCAAMGARPTWMVLALSLPAAVSDAWVAAFAAGLGEAAAEQGVALVGGDTTRSPGPVCVTITMAGRPVSAPVLRSGGRAGDDLWVSGALGLAGAGYLLADPPPEALWALRRPQARVALGLALAEAGLVTAMMDVSDGLVADLPRLATASGVGAHVDAQLVPIPACLADQPDPWTMILAAGDDYELLFSAPASARSAIEAVGARVGVPVTRIGALTEARTVTLEGRSWPTAPFTHFGAAGRR